MFRNYRDVTLRITGDTGALKYQGLDNLEKPFCTDLRLELWAEGSILLDRRTISLRITENNIEVR